MANREYSSFASGAVYKAVKNGDLPHISERDCEHCGKQAAVYHHEDYDKPLDIMPLCQKCHSAVHAEWRRLGYRKPKRQPRQVIIRRFRTD